MWRLLILVSLAPFIAGGLMANLFGLRFLLADQTISQSTRTFLEKLLACIDREDISVKFHGKSGSTDLANKSITLPVRYEDSKLSSHVARAAVDIGILLLHEVHPAPIEWRLKVRKLGNTLPVFILLIASFSCLIGKLPPMIGIAAFSASLGLSAALLWLSMTVEKEAALLIVERTEKLRLLPRLAEEEDLVSTIKAVPWSRLIPGALLKLILKD